MKIPSSFVIASSILLFPVASEAVTTTAPTTRFQGNISGVFTNPDTGIVTGVGTNNFTWGRGVPSRLTFTGKLFDVNVTTGYIYGPRARNEREVFSLGTLDYFNGTIVGGTGANSVQLDVRSQVTAPVRTNPTTFQTPLNLINTLNTSNPLASADALFLPKNLPPVVMNTPGGAPITLEIPGFGAISWKSNYNGKSGGVSFRNISPPEPGGTGGIFDLQLDLNPEDVSEEVRNLMTKDGSRNASLTIESPVTTPEPSTILASVLFLGASIFSQKGKKK